MGRTHIATGSGLPTGAAGSRFDATKGHVDSATLRRQGRVIPGPPFYGSGVRRPGGLCRASRTATFPLTPLQDRKGRSRTFVKGFRIHLIADNGVVTMRLLVWAAVLTALVAGWAPAQTAAAVAVDGTV